MAALLRSEAPSEVAVENYHYGYFSVLAFLIPVFRWLATRRFRRELLGIIRRYPDHDICLVAHSFGTHLVAWGLLGIPVPARPRIETVILAGSVLRSDFPWGELLGDRTVGRVINDCGLEDNILLLSQIFILMTGMAGRLGFTGMTGRRLMNRHFHGTHSHYFLSGSKPSDNFMFRYWLPTLAHGREAQPVDQRRVKGPLQAVANTLLTIADPLKFLTYGALLFTALNVGYYQPLVEARRDRELREVEKVGRLGRVAMRMIDSNTGVESAIAALGYAASADRTAAYPEFRNVLAHWLPKLASLDSLLREVPADRALVWRGAYYLKTSGELLVVPEPFTLSALTSDHQLMTLDSDSVFRVYGIPQDSSSAMEEKLSVPLAVPSEPAAVDAAERYLLWAADALEDVNIYYFPESQRVVLSGLSMAAFVGGQNYMEVGIDLSGRAMEAELDTASWEADPDCGRYLGRLEEGAESRANSTEFDPGYWQNNVMERFCDLYEIDVRSPHQLRFPAWEDEGRSWSVTDFTPEPAARMVSELEYNNPLPVVNGAIYNYLFPFDESYVLENPDGQEFVIQFVSGANYGHFSICSPSDGRGCEDLISSGQTEGLIIQGSGTRFAVRISEDMRYVVVFRRKFPGRFMRWPYAADVLLMPLDGSPPLEFDEVPDTYDGAQFNRQAGRLAMVGDSQLWMFDIATGRLLWRASLPVTPIAESTLFRGLFTMDVSLELTDDLVITQYGDQAVSAHTEEGAPEWISSALGFTDAGPLRFAASKDGTILVVHNGRELRVLSTGTGTFLTRRVEIDQVASYHKRDLIAASGGGPQDFVVKVEVQDDGTVSVHTPGLLITRVARATDADVDRLLRHLGRYTGISAEDGRTLLSAIPD